MGFRRILTGYRIQQLALVLLITVAGFSQRLAQRNWQGSGLTAQTWWPRATLCSLDLRRDRTRSLSGVTARLDEFQSMGCDALVLDILAPATSAGAPVSLTFGTLDDSDNLIEQMGRRKMRLVFDLPSQAEGEAASKTTLDQMRFWLSRGVAGFVLPAGSDALAHSAHQVTASALGTRVLIGDGLVSPAPAAMTHRAVTPDIQLSLRHLAAANDRASIEALRAILSSPSSLPPLPLLTLDDVPAPETPIDPALEFAAHRAQAAILLGNGPAAILPLSALSSHAMSSARTEFGFSPEELGLWVPAGGDPLGPSPQQEFAAWLHSLNDLRHTSPALRTGASTYVDLDLNEFLVWIVRPKGPGVPLLFACNLSSSAAHVSVARELRDLGIRANSVRTVLQTDPDPSQPASTLDDIALDASGVFVGELR